MRRIPTAGLVVSDEWEADAAEALEEVEKFENATRKARNKEIDRHAPKTWRLLKDDLAELSSDKCWYCEIRQDRSLGAVDHFRPKGKVIDSPAHPGYW